MTTTEAALRARIDELERQLAGLAGEKERFQRIFDCSNDAIFLVDPESDEILDANDKAVLLLGYTREELLAVPMSAIHPDELPRLQAFARSVSEQGRGFTNELACTMKNGKQRAAEMSAAVVDVGGRHCMIVSVRDVSERERLTRESAYLQGEIRRELGYAAIIGSSPAIAKVLDQIEAVAETSSSVLITGESGTGKELVARAIHERSRRRNRPLVRVNCPSVPAELFESEFFGHTRGAFTGAVQTRIGRFELADEGTLFLDELAEIPLALQSKLLRVLQEGQFERIGESRTRKVDVRIIAATNRDLEKECREGRFREDLYFRLAVFPVQVPPLRDRMEDVPILAEDFVGRSARQLSVPPPPLTQKNLAALQQYAWPGNVRELQNVIERALILARGGALHIDLANMGARLRSDAPSVPAGPDGMRLDDLARLEREILRKALDAAQWKIYGEDGAAALVGLRPTTLVSRMKRLGLARTASAS